MDEGLVEKVARLVWEAQYPTGTRWNDWAEYAQKNPDSFDGRHRSMEIARAIIPIVGEACAGVADMQAKHAERLAMEDMTDTRVTVMMASERIAQAIRAATGAGS